MAINSRIIAAFVFIGISLGGGAVLYLAKSDGDEMYFSDGTRIDQNLFKTEDKFKLKNGSLFVKNSIDLKAILIYYQSDETASFGLMNIDWGPGKSGVLKMVIEDKNGFEFRDFKLTKIRSRRQVGIYVERNLSGSRKYESVSMTLEMKVDGKMQKLESTAGVIINVNK